MNRQEAEQEFYGILEENGWMNLTGAEVQALLEMCSQADKDKKEVIYFKGQLMLVKFGYEIVKRFK